MSNSPRFDSIAQELASTLSLSGIIYVGKGAYKETYYAKDTAGNPIAVKLFDPLKCNTARDSREISAMKMCDTPLIGKLIDCGDFTCSKGGRFRFTIEEYIDGGNLTCQLSGGVLSSKRVAHIASILMRAIDYIRQLNLVHRDIKPDNIMFRSGSDDPVLVDFGLVRNLSETSLTKTFMPQGPGSPFYSAPEQLNNDKYLIKWRTDQFSLGVVLGICLTGRHPFEEPGMTDIDIVTKVASRGTCSLEFIEDATDKGLEGIIKMLEPWPVQRYSSPDDIIKYFESKG